jgi:hypothetical protein
LKELGSRILWFDVDRNIYNNLTPKHGQMNYAICQFTCKNAKAFRNCQRFFINTKNKFKYRKYENFKTQEDNYNIFPLMDLKSELKVSLECTNIKML